MRIYTWVDTPSQLETVVSASTDASCGGAVVEHHRDGTVPVVVYWRDVPADAVQPCPTAEDAGHVLLSAPLGRAGWTWQGVAYHVRLAYAACDALDRDGLLVATALWHFICHSPPAVGVYADQLVVRLNAEGVLGSWVTGLSAWERSLVVAAAHGSLHEPATDAVWLISVMNYYFTG